MQLHATSKKYKSPQYNSVPDQICLFPLGLVAFVEVKSTGEKPTSGQIREGNRLRELGFLCVVVDSEEQVDAFIKSMITVLTERLWSSQGR